VEKLGLASKRRNETMIIEEMIAFTKTKNFLSRKEEVFSSLS